MSRFFDRLKFCCAIVGIRGEHLVTELAERCAKIDPTITPEVIQGWITTEGRAMLLEHALVLRDVTGARPSWIVRKEGTRLSLQACEFFGKIHPIVERLPNDRLHVWLEIGREMTLIT